MKNHFFRSAALALLVVIGAITVFSQGDDKQRAVAPAVPEETLFVSGPERDALRMIKEGRQTFRFDTFGDEEFWARPYRCIVRLRARK